MEKKYWKNLQEVQPTQGFQADPAHDDGANRSMVDILADENNNTNSSRRDFLKWCGISFVSATVLSACENPVKKAIPYLNQPETIIPGKASWYASTYMHGNVYCPVLVKSRDGRPIKIEGNALSSITSGGTSARVQASVLSLYDSGARYHTPLANGVPTSWDAVDVELKAALNSLESEGKRMVLVTPTLLSPSTRALINEFRQRYTQLEHISWDAISYSAIRKAHEVGFGQAIIPAYRFDKAKLIISFDADFLGTWLSPIAFAKQYATTRKISEEKASMSRHIQFESRLSTTGASADERIPLKPSDIYKTLKSLFNQMQALSSGSTSATEEVAYNTRELAEAIMQHKGEVVVVAGQNHTGIQTMVAAINHMAGAYGSSIDITNTIEAGQDNQEAFEAFVNDMNKGEIHAALFYQVNPLYHHYNHENFSSGLQKTPFTVSFATTIDETAKACKYVLPDNHYLESWNDAEFVKNHFSLGQPLIHPIFKTRQFQDTLLAWIDQDIDFHQYIMTHWEKAIFPQQSFHQGFDSFWVEALQSGVHELAAEPASAGGFPALVIRDLSVLSQDMPQASDIEFSAYPSLALGDGHDANNPWLQELPEPISSVCWDNFAAVSPETASELGLAEGDMLRINEKTEVPVLFQPGQARNCFSIALGYGRIAAGISADKRGGNAFPLALLQAGDRQLSGPVSNWQKIGGNHVFARTQTHFSMEGRAIVRESTLDKYSQDPSAGNELHKYHEKHKSSLYPAPKFEGHHWALMIDLNACTGCSTCVIACQSENNIPVIGKEEVRRRRIMHWIRIDRYYTGDAENPGVVFQPLMCQHCDHAPCENVCPVAATTHSQEGINQITYNRCVGTKYCINNCPYKVRRFNWFEYATKEKFNTHTTTDLGRMVLNPDVTVRERGVVEKCSFCVQRIQEAKLQAKNERRQLQDGEIVPACAQACPSNALVFGDLNDKNSRVSKLIKDPRNYHLLEELHTLPSVGYLTKIKNS
jgi:MoCo/4Fe-4S cofactor protein with predicted Tat translocation signal